MLTGESTVHHAITTSHKAALKDHSPPKAADARGDSKTFITQTDGLIHTLLVRLHRTSKFLNPAMRSKKTAGMPWKDLVARICTRR